MTWTDASDEPWQTTITRTIEPEPGTYTLEIRAQNRLDTFQAFDVVIDACQSRNYTPHYTGGELLSLRFDVDSRVCGCAWATISWSPTASGPRESFRRNLWTGRAQRWTDHHEPVPWPQAPSIDPPPVEQRDRLDLTGAGSAAGLTLPAWVHLTHAERWTLGHGIARRYASGESIRRIAESLGRSYGFVHRLLHETDIRIRPPGERPAWTRR